MKYSTAYPFRIPAREMVCVYCCESCADPADYRQHMQTEHASFNIATALAHVPNSNLYIKVDCTEWKCRLCDQPFETLESMSEHLNEAHGKNINLKAGFRLQIFNFTKKWFCTICDEKLPCLRTLSRHTTTHYHKHACETCGRTYMSQENLQKHLEFNHTKEKMCVKCKTSFPDIESRRRHIEQSTRCWSFTCAICNERFPFKRSKSDHLKAVHGKFEKNYPCPDCEQVFEKLYSYQRHFIRTHTNKFCCPFCNKNFTSGRQLDAHTVTHTKEKKFECSVCSKCFGTEKNLYQHSWVHNEHKRFECAPCNKKFNQKVSWRTHMKSYHPEMGDLNKELVHKT